MNYWTTDFNVFECNGTHLQGYITADYFKLVKLFGEPGCGDDYKTDAEWSVKFDDGTIATIYNWKNGKNYCGSDGQAVESIRNWNVGGFNSNAVARIKELL